MKYTQLKSILLGRGESDRDRKKVFKEILQRFGRRYGTLAIYESECRNFYKTW